jgi:hypothetical protein
VPAARAVDDAKPVKFKADEYTDVAVETIVGVFDIGVLPFMDTITVALFGVCKDIPMGSPINTYPPIGRRLVSV